MGEYIWRILFDSCLLVGMVYGWITSYKSLIAKPIKKASIEKSVWTRYLKISFTYVIIILISFFIFILSKDLLENIVKLVYI